MSYDGTAVGATVEAIPELIARVFERKGSDGGSLRSLRNHLVFVTADETRSEEMRKKMVRRLALAELIKPGLPPLGRALSCRIPHRNGLGAESCEPGSRNRFPLSRPIEALPEPHAAGDGSRQTDLSPEAC
jgi:hypothetical protein